MRVCLDARASPRLHGTTYHFALIKQALLKRTNSPRLCQVPHQPLGLWQPARHAAAAPARYGAGERVGWDLGIRGDGKGLDLAPVFYEQ